MRSSCAALLRSSIAFLAMCPDKLWGVWTGRPGEEREGRRDLFHHQPSVPRTRALQRSPEGLQVTPSKGLGLALGRVGVCVRVYFISHILSHAGETLPVFQIYVFGSLFRPWSIMDSDAGHVNTIQHCRFKLPSKHPKTPMFSPRKFREIIQQLGTPTFRSAFGLYSLLMLTKTRYFEIERD